MSAISIFSIEYSSTDGNPTNQKIEKLKNLCTLQSLSGGGTKYFPVNKNKQLKSLGTKAEIFKKRLKCDIYLPQHMDLFANCDYFTTLQIKNIR